MRLESRLILLHLAGGILLLPSGFVKLEAQSAPNATSAPTLSEESAHAAGPGDSELALAEPAYSAYDSETTGEQLETIELPDKTSEGSKTAPAGAITPGSQTVDLSNPIFYKNRLEFSLDGGWLPINIPFVFDVFLGDGYTMTTLRYTLVPIIASLRWHLNAVDGPWIFRGNWDMTFSGSTTAIPRGPETRYFSYDMGIRRNFVPRRGKMTPYFDGRLGLGRIDAKEPAGVVYAQGQNFTFTVNMGSGIRYNFNSRYSISGGLNWMHISNLYLSEPKFANYGINVYGPMFGLGVRLGKPHHGSE